MNLCASDAERVCQGVIFSSFVLGKNNTLELLNAIRIRSYYFILSSLIFDLKFCLLLFNIV